MRPNYTANDIARSIRAFLFGDNEAAAQACVTEAIAAPSRSALDTLREAVTVQDIRETPRSDKHKRGRRRGLRSWDTITGICLHQTASPLGSQHRLLPAVPAHAHVGQDGIVTLLQPATAYMYHAHALNRFTIGIEVEARAAGTEGLMSTFWRSSKEKAAGTSPESLTREATAIQLRSLDALICYYIDLHRRNASPPVSLLGLYAHRQGHASRTSDPGSKIARHVFREFCASPTSSHGILRDTTTETYGSGKPWPREWIE